MSIFAEYLHGQISKEEFLSDCRWEERKDEYYEEHIEENKEDEDDE